MVINVCIVGLGHAAKIHAEGYKNNKWASLEGRGKVVAKTNAPLMQGICLIED